MALAGAILTKEPEPLSGALPPQLGRIIKCALEKETEKRYASAGEMRRELRTAITAQASDGKPDVKTQVLPHRVTELPSPPTSPGSQQKSQEIVSTITAQIPAVDLPQLKDSVSLPARKANRRPGLVDWLVALVFIGILTAIFGYFIFGPVDENSEGADNHNLAGSTNNSPELSPASSPFSNSSQAKSSPGGNATNESWAKIDANKPLDDYSAYQSGDGYYVTIPKTKMSSLTITTSKSISQPSWEERPGGDVVLKFELEAGMTARVQQSFNRLEITFSIPH